MIPNFTDRELARDDAELFRPRPRFQPAVPFARGPQFTSCALLLKVSVGQRRLAVDKGRQVFQLSAAFALADHIAALVNARCRDMVESCDAKTASCREEQDGKVRSTVPNFHNKI